MESYAYTPEGKSQAKRLVESRIAVGCSNAKDFYNQYGKGKGVNGKDLFSYPQYQKYESGERLLGRKAAILFAKIFNKDWEWLQKGDKILETDEDFSNLSEEEKDLIRKHRKSQKTKSNQNTYTKAG